MQFTVPQFIEHQAKIIGPLTLKQFAFVGSAALAIIILWFTVAEDNFLLFLLSSVILATLAIGLAFVKVNEKSLPQLLINILTFSLGPKLYLWRRKETPIKMIKLVRKKPVEIKEDTTKLKLGGKSKLNDLSKTLGTR